MRIETDSEFSSMIFEDIVIGNSAKLYANGMVHGNIQVESGSELYLSGMLNGYLAVEENATAYILGVMNGPIIECEGTIELSGMLNTDSEVPKKVVKKKGCYINNKQY
ncbi:MAG: hypothetical protein IJF60_00025 [Agathobacter sp.]|nr:hypothetical protein [Agathobacter sp.]